MSGWLEKLRAWTSEWRWHQTPWNIIYGNYKEQSHISTGTGSWWSSTRTSPKYMMSASPITLASANALSQGDQGRPAPESGWGTISTWHTVGTASRSWSSTPWHTYIAIGEAAKSPRGYWTTDTTHRNSAASAGTSGVGSKLYSGVSRPVRYL